MKKILALVLACALLVSCASVAFAADFTYYKQRQSNEASFETMAEALVNGPASLSAEYGRAYGNDLAMQKYKGVDTSFVYRSAGYYTASTNANRMNTNVMVYTDEVFADKDAAWAFLTELGLPEMVDGVTGSIILVTPINGKAFGADDQYDFYLMQCAMCNIGGSTTTAEGARATVAEPYYFGGLTYRYLIGIDGGATFLNDYVATQFDFITRIAGMLLVNGAMEKVRTVAAAVPAWLVNPAKGIAEKYAKANATDSYGRNGDTELYFNADHPLQQVLVSYEDEVDLAAYVKAAYYDFFLKAMRVPVVKGSLYTGEVEFRNVAWNQAPYSLGERNPIINGKTPDGIYVFERQGEQFADITTSDGQYVSTWYELLPETIVNGTAKEHSIPLLLCNHGGGDDPIQAIDELGWLYMAGKEQFAIVAERHTSEKAGSFFGAASPFDICSDVLPAMVRYMLETYPALDPSRVYVSGYSMGGSATNRAVYGDASVFAAAVNCSGTPYAFTEGQDAQFADIDIPMMLTTCTYDTATHFDSAAGHIAVDFQENIVNYLKYNEMPNDIEFDFDTYEFSGFKGDIYRQTMVNDEYPMYQWFFLNEIGAPMVGLTVIEFLPHGLYQEYAKVAWEWMHQFSRDPETLEIIYNPYANE